MEAKVGHGTSRVSYDEFEPFCKWQREESSDTLVVHIPEFKKEQLRVALSNRGILKISGERPLDAARKSKFYKELEVPKNCNTNGIQAKFANGCLYILIPKFDHEKTKSEPKNEKPRVDENQETGSTKEKIPPPVTVSPVGETSRQDVAQLKEKNFAKMAVNVALVVAAVASLLFYVLYMYRSMLDEA